MLVLLSLPLALVCVDLAVFTLVFFAGADAGGFLRDDDGFL